MQYLGIMLCIFIPFILRNYVIFKSILLFRIFLYLYHSLSFTHLLHYYSDNPLFLPWSFPVFQGLNSFKNSSLKFQFQLQHFSIYLVLNYQQFRTKSSGNFPKVYIFFIVRKDVSIKWNFKIRNILITFRIKQSLY